VQVAETPALTPARWVDSSGSTLIGPTLPSGTLVLLGGRRALVAKDGTTTVETAPTPEGLIAIIEVPNVGGKRRLIGHGPHTIYRFDDPLGAPTALARSEVLIDHIGGGPGLVAVWDYQSYAPRFIDVDTGQPKTLAGLPALPIRAVAFLNAKEGAAAFEAAGLATTIDGGATWRLAGDGGKNQDALRITGLRLRGDAVRAFVYSNGPDAAVDIAQARIARLTETPAASGEPALIRWIRATERDPLEVAAATGVDSPAGGALIASHGMLARVDTKTGALLEIVEFSKGYGLAPCEVARAGGAAWMGCILSEDGAGSGGFVDPFAVMRVPLAAGKLTPDSPSLRRSGEASLRASPSGGLMLVSSCSPDDEGDVCVRQPDGTWTTLSVRADAFRNGVGPLSDGRAVFVRGLEEGDEPAEEQDAPGVERSAEEAEAASRARRPTIIAVDKSGKESRLVTLSALERPEAQLRVHSYVEEDEDRTLRFVLVDEEGAVYSVVQPPTREGALLQRIPQATHALIHAGRGLAVGEGRVTASVDGGSTWVEAATPARVRDALADIGATYFEEPGTFLVSEVGAKIDTQLRIGWGHADLPAEPKVSVPSATLGPRSPAPFGPEKTLTCVSAPGAAQGTPPLQSAQDLLTMFFKGKPPKSEKGKRVTLSSAQTGRAGMLDTLAVLEETGTDKPGDLPKTWTIRWIEPAEVGAKARSWSGPPPKGAPWGSNLRGVSASGGRALFTLRVAGKYLLVRTKGAGAIETAEVDNDRMPTSEVMFGAEKGEPIVWLHDTSVVVWIQGEAPRIIATVGGRATRTLGQPGKDGVPVLLSFSDMALMTTLPIPALPKAPAGQKPPPPAAVSLDGWVSAPNVVRRDASRVPSCGAKPKGARFTFSARQLNLRVDGSAVSSPDALYDVRVAPGEACVAAVSALMPLSRRPAIPPPTNQGAAKPAPPKPGTTQPATFVRVDFAGKRADGGERGVPGTVRKMNCSM
jgi:hypothetical protein